MIDEYGIFDDCYIMQPDDIENFARTLADGFSHYPLFEYVCGGKNDHRKMELVWMLSIALSADSVIAIADSKEANSVLLYVRPGATQPGLFSYLRAGGIKLLLKLGLRSAIRLLHFESYAQTIASKYQTSADGYILAFATRLDKQGQHYGKQLLAALLRYLDAFGQGCYIETLKPENVGFYEHFGFELREQTIAPCSNLPMFSMLRQSQSRACRLGL